MSGTIQTIKNKKGVVITPGKTLSINGVKIYPLIPDKIEIKGNYENNQNEIVM